jgi:flagellar biosynthetic protein FlhB
MAEESDLEKTEPASARRLEQAREEGQVPRSREVGAFVILIVAAMAFWLMGPWLVQRMAEIFRGGLRVDSSLAREPTMMLVRLADLSLDTLLIFVPLFAGTGRLQPLLSPFFLGSWNFSMKALQPDLSRLDPLKGMARLVSWAGLVELVKAVAKAFTAWRRCGVDSVA